MIALLSWIANLCGLSRTFGDVQHLIIACALHQKARRGITGLPGIVHAFINRGRDALLKVAVGKNEVGGLASQFKRHPLDGVCRITCYGRAGAGRTGKRHHLNIGMARQG